GAHMAHETPCAGVGLGNRVTCGLASAGRRNGGWVCREFQMAKDLADHCALWDDSNESQHPALTKWTRAHLQGKHALQESGPGPIRGALLRLLRVYPLLTRGGDDPPAEVVISM